MTKHHLNRLRNSGVFSKTITRETSIVLNLTTLEIKPNRSLVLRREAANISKPVVEVPLAGSEI